VNIGQLTRLDTGAVTRLADQEPREPGDRSAAALRLRAVRVNLAAGHHERAAYVS
jgi:hypothetical protein